MKRLAGKVVFLTGGGVLVGRFGRPEDVSELALFLASDAASWLTGQAIVLDGGISCNYFSNI